MKDEFCPQVRVEGSVMSKKGLAESFAAKTHYEIECRDADGNLKWVEAFDNLIPNAGLNDVLDKYLKGSSYTAAFYVGLLQAAASPAIAAGDTMASHSGWTEFTGYTNSPDVRPTLTLGTVASQSVDNSASVAAFAVTLASPESSTIDGAFICTDDTKGGTSGVLFSAGFFSSAKSVGNGDTLNVTATVTAAAA